MEGLSKCPCGRELASIWRAYDKMREIYIADINKNSKLTSIERFDLLASENVDLGPIFEQLGIERKCCKTHLTTKQSFHDFLNE